MLQLELPIWGDIAVFVAGALAIGIAGTKLAGLADRLADRTGLGEAITGALLLGFITALPGVTASVTAAVGGYPALSISNALGGIAVQTAFLAVGDIFHPRTNLEHAAASVPNLMQVIVLISLITLVLLALSGPDFTIAHVHPVTVILFVVAGFGFRLVYRSRKKPMWKPERTPHTVEDVPEPEARHESLPGLFLAIVPTAAIVLASGAIVAETAGNLAEETGISQSVMGGLFTAVATSLPELVTTVAAVRRGALTLAVSDIVGGNFFDVLFVFAADLVYLRGSLYHAPGVGRREGFLTAMALLLNVTLLLGLLYRQRRGPANIGFESILMLVVCVGGFLIVGLLL